MHSERSRRLIARIPLWLPVWVGAFLVQFFVLNMIADSRHFLPDGDDMKFYDDWARRILGGRLTDGKAFYGLPGYAYALAGIYKVTGGYDHVLAVAGRPASGRVSRVHGDVAFPAWATHFWRHLTGGKFPRHRHRNPRGGGVGALHPGAGFLLHPHAHGVGGVRILGADFVARLHP